MPLINSRLAKAFASLLFANIATLGQSTPLKEQGLRTWPRGWSYPKVGNIASANSTTISSSETPAAKPTSSRTIFKTPIR